MNIFYVLILCLFISCTQNSESEADKNTHKTKNSNQSSSQSFDKSADTQKIDPLKKCNEDIKKCGDISFDSPQAKIAYTKGCEAHDFVSCARLAQIYEVKEKEYDLALKYYRKACDSKESTACDSEYELYMKLCYELKETKYCSIKEPKDEYRVIAFLSTFDIRYEDAIILHDFNEPFQIERTEVLLDQAIKEKNPVLLAALKKRSDDGHGAEVVSQYIKRITGEPIKKQ